jgi:glycosyltransferase involved in cell wall biosynthesis
MADLVSVIIPTYNRAELLPFTIRTVLNQTYQSFEIIIVDDGSTDNTSDVVLSFHDDRIRYFQIDHKGFPAPARNKGIQEARGVYIAMLDSDDLWFSSKLMHQIHVFEENPAIKLISTNFTFFTKDKEPQLKLRMDTTVSFKKILKHNLIMNSSVVFKKDIVKEIGYLDDRPIFKSVEDYDYWLRILHSYDNSVLILKECLTVYRVHEHSISDIANVISPLIELNRLFKIYKKYLGEDEQFVNQVVRRHYNFIHYHLDKKRVMNSELGLLQFLKDKKILANFKIRGILYFISRRLEKYIPSVLNWIFHKI